MARHLATTNASRHVAASVALAVGLIPAMAGGALGERWSRLEIEPGAVLLLGPRGDARVIATAYRDDGTLMDLTDRVAWSIAHPEIAAIHSEGRVRAIGDGATEIVATIEGLEARASLEVVATSRPDPIGFTREVLPVLTRAGCNQGGCHGTPTGKNGFRLSLRGYDPTLDHRTLAREVGARRVDPFDPGSSLILQKAYGVVPHEGGRRLSAEDPESQILRTWIGEGLRPDRVGIAPPVGLSVIPSARILDEPAREQRLVVRARFADGTERDVTGLATFKSTDETTAQVEPSGRVLRLAAGEATVLVNYGHLYATSRLIFRVPVPGLEWVDPPVRNDVDTHLFAKLKLLQIPPSESCDDATFCRRAYLDIIGLPPRPEDVRAFLADDRPEKRSRLIDELLERPEYADFWGLKWADNLGNNQRFNGHKGAYSYSRWIRDQVAANTPLDQFARAIITAGGSNYTSPPASFYRRVRGPEDAVEAVSQLFMGVRLQCARCHNHVAERWTQDDYYGMAAFFGQVRYKNGPQTYALYNKEETIYLRADSRVVQPRTGERMRPNPLGTEPPEIERGTDYRIAFADWLTDPSNPFFARAAVNRIWFHLMGQGIVEPVDDMRDSNPPVSEELLAALADDFTRHGFDVKHVIRTIANSRAYQLDSRPNAFNAHDQRYFSHAKVRLLAAEQLLDAASQATNVPETFFHLPRGLRAAQVPDGEFNHPFLRSFGQPLRSDACECERPTDSTLDQALQIVGGRTLHNKLIEPKNRIGMLLDRGATDDEIVEELFLATLARPPDEEERGVSIAALESRGDDRRRAAEDLLWSLLNHPEFLFRR